MKFDYFYYKNLYTVDECHILRKKVIETIDPTVKDLKAQGVKKTATVGSFALGLLKNELQKFNQTILSINRNNFGFNLFETCDLEYINFNTYDEINQGEYSWHADKVLNEPYDIKLTAILNIGTEKFSGGEFELFLNGETCIEEITEPGSILVFPSYIQHRVKPVTSGTRLTISRWLNGPNFK